jgi:putative tryptophan/tyrosine transport system substrate-binding protein
MKASPNSGVCHFIGKLRHIRPAMGDAGSCCAGDGDLRNVLASESRLDDTGDSSAHDAMRARLLAIGPEIGPKSALAATRTLPIVMIAIDYDPLARGYVTSLARPSGNVTGVVFQQIELAAKRIQLIKDGFSDRPAATMFWDQLSADQWEAARSTAGMLGLQLFGIELRELPYDYEAALRKAPLDHRGLLIVPTSPSFFRDRARLADFALQHRLLSMFVFREWVDAGGLLCYGPSITALFARVAEFVDRIARGATPSDLPIEQPTKFEMVVNLKTAKAIGIELPTAILLRADEVIE